MEPEGVPMDFSSFSSGEHHAGDGGRVEKRGFGDLGRVAATVTPRKEARPESVWG